jgi:MYXO-CTERM domain-containing protein
LFFMFHELIRLTSRLLSVAAAGLLLGTTSGCLVAAGTESEAELGEVASPVIGGAAATKNEIFSTVALLAPGEPEYICSGILIAPSVVVTAAHCLYKDEDKYCQTQYAPYDLTVVAGALDATTASAAQHYDIAKMFTHDDFLCPLPAFGRANDLAIVLLKGSITSLTPVPTIKFDKIKSALSPGTLVTIQGYGARDVEMTQFGQLYVARTPYQEAKPTEFIAGALSAPDACVGDSGGPVYLTVNGKKYLVGMTSRRNDDEDAGCKVTPMGGIYTILGVDDYDAWLKAESGGAYAGSTFLSSDGGVDGSSSGIPGCNCQVGGAPASSGSGFWMGLGVALLAAKRRQAVR